MAKTDRSVEINFTQPWRQIALMLLALFAFAVGVYFALPEVAPVFLANIYLNGFIAAVFVIGLIACVWQVVELINSVHWIEGFTTNREGHENASPSRLLAPLASLLKSRGRMTIASSSARSILESVETRIEEVRDISRYLTSLLVFLGLLGTFYGLATTVPAVVETIRSLAPAEGEDGVAVFGRLMLGLEKQLGGMGTAFASSLLGLTGSLVIGLMELFVNNGQNRFYRELEDWLSTITRLGFSSGESEVAGDSSGLALLAGQMSEQMELFQTAIERTGSGSSAVDSRLAALAVSVDRLAHSLTQDDNPNPTLTRIAEGQERLIALIAKQSEAEGSGQSIDAESRMRLRSIDVQLLRILEEMSAGRQESLADLRTDLASLTRAIRQLPRETAPALRKG
jgi:hypothetical protein